MQGTMTTFALHRSIRVLMTFSRRQDFRVITFSFKCSRLDEDRAITTSLLHYCYPHQPQRMFAFDYKSVDCAI